MDAGSVLIWPFNGKPQASLPEFASACGLPLNEITKTLAYYSDCHQHAASFQLSLLWVCHEKPNPFAFAEQSPLKPFIAGTSRIDALGKRWNVSPLMAAHTGSSRHLFNSLPVQLSPPSWTLRRKAGIALACSVLI
jgi:hypothetical protein